MKNIAVLKPLKTSAAALKRKKRLKTGGGYGVASVLSFPKLLYLVSASETDRGTEKNVFSAAFNKQELNYRFAAYFGFNGAYGAGSVIKKLGDTSESLFKTYAGLNRLTQALWSIYKSNNLQLSHSLLALIRTINEKNGIELEAFFDEIPKIIQIREKMIGVLKKTDHSLLEKIYSRYGNLSVVNIRGRDIYRHTDTVRRGVGKTVISRLNENISSMTSLLTRVYEEIEAGVYLYSADSYRNAKTLQRLTNSLWKVYLGQNMELSRSFSRLITRVNLENKSAEQRNSENNMFADNRSLKNLVNALRKAFSGSNLELRNSMISLFGDIHNAGARRNISVNRRCDLRHGGGIVLIIREIVPEHGHIRLDHRKTERLDRTERADAYSRFEREIKSKLGQLEKTSNPAPPARNTEDIVRDVLEKVNRKQQLDWRLEKLQRGIF